jgi:hypothetical protein
MGKLADEFTLVLFVARLVIAGRHRLLCKEQRRSEQGGGDKRPASLGGSKRIEHSHLR